MYGKAFVLSYTCLVGERADSWGSADGVDGRI